MTTLSVTIDASGASAPTFSFILSSLQAQVQAIYGADVYLDPDSQDGQILGIYASAQNDTNNSIIAAYQSFSPTYAQGAGLSSNVKINGLRRQASSNSSAPGLVVGQAGTLITNGVVQDQNGFLWNLPPSVTIPPGGDVVVTATAQRKGDITAAAGTINAIFTPTYGWQSFASTADADPGAPVETDATLRGRQYNSTAAPAQSIVEAIFGALGNLAGVTRVQVYENDTKVTDVNGVPSNTISAVVEGGDAFTIASTIALKKTPGTGTYGTTTEVVTDARGLSNPINFFILGLQQIYVTINLVALTGYASNTGVLIQASIVEFLNTLGIGGDVLFWDLGAPATLSGSAAQTATGLTQAQLDTLRATFRITSITVGTAPAPVGTTDVSIPFNQASASAMGNIVLNVS